MYIPPFVCGVIVGAVGMLALIVGLALYFQYKEKSKS